MQREDEEMCRCWGKRNRVDGISRRRSGEKKGVRYFYNGNQEHIWRGDDFDGEEGTCWRLWGAGRAVGGHSAAP